MTKIEAAKLVAMLLQAYPNAQISPATSQTYELHLADLEAVGALEAVNRLIRTSKWLPTIAEIRGMVVDVSEGPRRLGGEAWADVNNAVRFIGSYRPPPVFEDPIVARCVDAMGWKNLCLSTNDAADRARFIEIYEGMVDRQRADIVAGRALPPASGQPTNRLKPWDGPKRLGSGEANPVAQLVQGLRRIG
jgi:hypothetical protein